ncbi:GAF domain-containing protein [Chloroflexales bacterium ZM16-3]|nr:GAF domain-containing protein [Chloroflexales bacterium ZM16-3]
MLRSNLGAPGRSLLGQILGTYLVFVLVVLGAGLAVTAYVRGRLQEQVQASDLALAQAIALELDNKLQHAQAALVDLAQLDDLRGSDELAMASIFRAFKAARQDVDSVYWLNADGLLRVSIPSSARTVGTDYSGERIFQRARESGGPLVEAGVVDLTTFNPVAVLGHPVYSDDGRFLGVVAANLLLDELSAPLRTIVSEQGSRMNIQVLDGEGRLIASPDRARLLQQLLPDLPGAEVALAGRAATRLGAGRDGQSWLFSAEPVGSVGWAVVVQRHTSDAFAVVTDFSRWLTALAILFAGGGVIFWLMLSSRVIGPIQLIARHNRSLPMDQPLPPTLIAQIARRPDEVGDLARSLHGLRQTVAGRIAELQTLLATSTAVVGTLDPTAVARQIISAVGQLVNVQAATVIVPNDQGILRVLVSEGHSGHAKRTLTITPDNPQSPSAMALREGRPVQMIAGESPYFPQISYSEGFRALLAIPIISAHVGGVVLLVYRTRPQPFSADEIGLLLTFANHATLAWEHAVLYERSDERLREIARENARLYQEAAQERRLLSAIMASMDDGLVLARDDGVVLYANRGVGAMLDLADEALVGQPITAIHAALDRLAASQPPRRVDERHADDGRTVAWAVELRRGEQALWVQLREFDVGAPSGQLIGRGLLLRDVTHERALDQFKTTLLGAVSHELRTPLAAIKGHASTLLQTDVRWSEADQRHFLGTINAEADRMATLMRNLLDMARLEAGLLALDRSPWLIDGLIRRAVSRMGTPAGRVVEVDLPADLPPAMIDQQRIDVVLRNLLANGLLYGGDRLLVRARAEGDSLLVQVTDDGAGIPPDELPHIFERFYRAQTTSQRHPGGTGLGLAICKAFVEAHGGRIWAESDEVGTTFSFTLPVASLVEESVI